jgi:hypothetical protein
VLLYRIISVTARGSELMRSIAGMTSPSTFFALASTSDSLQAKVAAGNEGN